MEENIEMIHTLTKNAVDTQFSHENAWKPASVSVVDWVLGVAMLIVADLGAKPDLSYTVITAFSFYQRRPTHKATIRINTVVVRVSLERLLCVFYLIVRVPHILSHYGANKHVCRVSFDCL